MTTKIVYPRIEDIV